MEVEKAMERHSLIDGLTRAIASKKGQMSGLAVNVDPSASSSMTAALCRVSRVAWGQESSAGS